MKWSSAASSPSLVRPAPGARPLKYCRTGNRQSNLFACCQIKATMRRTKASLICRRTKNIRAVQLLLSQSKVGKHSAIPRNRSRRRTKTFGTDGDLTNPTETEQVTGARIGFQLAVTRQLPQVALRKQSLSENAGTQRWRCGPKFQ